MMKKNLNYETRHPPAVEAGKEAAVESKDEIYKMLKKTLSIGYVKKELSKLEPSQRVLGNVYNFKNPYIFGECLVTKCCEGKFFVSIVINEQLVGQPRKIVKTTIAHEIAHAMVGVDEGHSENWKAVASRLSKDIGGYYPVTKDPLDGGFQISPSYWIKN